jgi:hypothetical protein
MKQFLELLEARQDLDNLISESIAELTVSEVNILNEALEAPENDAFQRLDNIRAINPANTLGIITNAVKSKKDNQAVMDKLNKLENPSLADVRNYRSKQEVKRRAREIGTNLGGAGILGAAVGALDGAADPDRIPRNKKQLIKNILSTAGKYAAAGAGVSAVYGLPDVGLSILARKTIGRHERGNQDKRYLDNVLKYKQEQKSKQQQIAAAADKAAANAEQERIRKSKMSYKIKNALGLEK